MGPREAATAILALAPVPRIHVDAAETDVPLRQPIIVHQQDNAWRRNRSVQQADPIRPSSPAGPRPEIPRLILRIDRARSVPIQKRNRAADGGDVDRKVRPIQHEHSAVEYRPHVTVTRYSLATRMSIFVRWRIAVGRPPPKAWSPRCPDLVETTRPGMVGRRPHHFGCLRSLGDDGFECRQKLVDGLLRL